MCSLFPQRPSTREHSKNLRWIIYGSRKCLPKGTSAWRMSNGFTLTLLSTCNNSKYSRKPSPKQLLFESASEGSWYDDEPKTIFPKKTNKQANLFSLQYTTLIETKSFLGAKSCHVVFHVYLHILFIHECTRVSIKEPQNDNEYSLSIWKFQRRSL